MPAGLGLDGPQQNSPSTTKRFSKHADEREFRFSLQGFRVISDAGLYLFG